MIDGVTLQHVPGCENGDAPYSQELIGGGKVNRSFLVRTRRGKFVVRLNESTEVDAGLDRQREIVLHTAAANSGMAPHIIYASPDHSCLVTDYLEGRLWTSHYFTRMRDLRSLGQRLRTLHAITPPSMPRFDPLAAARRYADVIVQDEPSEAARLEALLESGAASLARSGSARRAPTIVHNDLHSGNVITADRLYFIDWEYAQVGDPLLDLAALITYYPRASAHASLLLSASGLDSRGATPVMLEELTNVFTLLTYLWYRARRIKRAVSGTDLALEFAALRRLQPLAPGAEGRHT